MGIKIYAADSTTTKAAAAATDHLDADMLQRIITATGYAAYCSAADAAKLADNVRLLRGTGRTASQCPAGYLYRGVLCDVMVMAMCMYSADDLHTIVIGIN